MEEHTLWPVEGGRAFDPHPVRRKSLSAKEVNEMTAFWLTAIIFALILVAVLILALRTVSGFEDIDGDDNADTHI